MNSSEKENTDNIPVKYESNPNLSSVSGLSEISGLLNSISFELKEIVKNSEQDFLFIGNKLNVYLAQSRALYLSSSNVASSITRKVLENGIADLNHLLKQIINFLTDSIQDIKNNKEQLNSVLDKIEGIIEQIGEFKAIVKHLKMLGISTKIESSRLGNDDEGFFALAENVDKLSKIISDQALFILNKAVFLLNTIKKTINFLSEMEIVHNKQVEVIINKANSTLKTFEEQCSESYLKAGNLSVSLQNIEKNIGDIVISIQFHDIIRQKMEHVLEAVSGFIPQHNRGSFNQEENSEQLTRFGAIHDVCELQSFQLENAGSEFSVAVEAIISNLTDFQKNIEQIYADTSDFLGENSLFSGKSIKNLKEDLFAISTELNQNAGVGEELTDSVKSVLHIVEELILHFTEIEKTGTDIELIALNARIKAAHTGQNGTALGVLAESIQKLSVTAKELTNKTTEILGSIESSTHLLKSFSSEEEDAKINSINQRIDEILESILNQYGNSSRGISEIKSNVEKFKNDINVTINGISIHNKLHLAVSGIRRKLSEITKIIKTNINLKSNKEQNTNLLLENYTMQSERITHMNYHINRLENTDGGMKKTDKESNDYFGDNVELF